jgi:hypothetical protein
MSNIAIYVHELSCAKEILDCDKDGHASISKLIGEGYQIITL